MSEILRKKLRDRFDEGVRKNPKFSIRALAKKLGISHTSLRKLLTSDTAAIGPTLALYLMKKMNFDERQIFSPYLNRVFEIPVQYRAKAYACLHELENLSVAPKDAAASGELRLCIQVQAEMRAES